MKVENRPAVISTLEVVAYGSWVCPIDHSPMIWWWQSAPHPAAVHYESRD